MSKVAKINQSKTPPRAWDFAAMPFFKESDAIKISKLAIGLSDEEVIAYYGLEDTSPLTEYEQRFLKITIMQGRAEGKHNATEKLFKVMGSTSPKAADACLAYLQSHAENWKNVSATSTGGSGKTVSITINDGTDEEDAIIE